MKLSVEIDDLLQDVKGGQWKPRVLKPAVVHDLYQTIQTLQGKLDGLTEPEIQKQLASLDYHVGRANQFKGSDNVEFLEFVLKALDDVQSVVNWYFQNKGLLKEEEENG